MPLPLTVDKLDAIPEPLRAAYVERDGRFALDAEFEDVSGLKNTIAATRKERDDAKKAAKEERERREAVERERQAIEDEKAGVTKEAKARWHKEELEPVAKERDTYKTKYLDRALAGEVKGILADLDVIDVNAAYRLLGDDFELGEDEAPALKADPTADVRKHLEKVLTEKYPYLLKGSQAAGGGVGGQRRGGGAAGDNVFQWSEAQRADFIQKNGYDAYKAKLDAAALAQATAPKKAAA